MAARRLSKSLIRELKLSMSASQSEAFYSKIILLQAVKSEAGKPAKLWQAN